MELHQLEYVLAVAQYQSFTRAAEEINISQSSLSQQINKLENELGIKLFERTTRNVHLTPAGDEFVLHAKRIMAEISAAKRTIQEYLSIERGNINLGVFPVIGHFQLTSLLASFHNNFPRVKLHLTEAECEILLNLLKESKIDAALLSEMDSDSFITYHRLINDEIVLVTSNLHPLATHQTIDLRELSKEKFIIVPPTSGLYKNFAGACRKAGFEPEVLYHCTQVTTTLGLVRENLGVAVLSSQVAMKYLHLGLSIIRLIPTVPRRISLAVPKNAQLSPTLKVFIKFTQQWANLKSSEKLATAAKIV